MIVVKDLNIYEIKIIVFVVVGVFDQNVIDSPTQVCGIVSDSFPIPAVFIRQNNFDGF